MTITKQETTFEIKGEVVDLKLTWKATRYLADIYEGGTFELIGKAIMGNLETFPHIIYASVMHSEKDYSLSDVEDALDDAVNSGALTMHDILRLSNLLITKSPFYASTVDKLLVGDDNARQSIDALLAE